MSKPIIAIIGRQNVGKSTLLNKVAGKPLAIVEDIPGTTRDRLFADVSWQGAEFTMVDTGGLEFTAETSIAKGVREQTKAAIAEADVIIFLTDVKTGLLPLDIDIAEMLRKSEKPLILAVNKVDSTKQDAEAAEFNKLGFGELVNISAYHGRGVADLLDRVVGVLPAPAVSEQESGAEGAVRVAIAGRPGVGKSLLLNALLGKERVIVGETPGTTRDAIDTLLDFHGQNVVVIDTAGIRRRGRVTRGIEWYSVIRAMRAIDRADVVLLVLDATELITAQDMHIAGYVQQVAKGVIIVVNKWDLTPYQGTAETMENVQKRLKFFTYAPILFVSAKLGQGINKILPLVLQVQQERTLQIPASEVSRVIRQAYESHNIPRKGKKQLKISSAVQSGIKPPTFTFNVNDVKIIHFSYQRYLENQLRGAFDFIGTPIRLVFKAGGEK